MAAPVPAAAKTLYGTMDAEKGLDGSDAKLHQKPLGWLGLTMLIFFNVSGGPFVSEDAVGQAGPLFALLGIIFMMLLYAVPSALYTAELATAFPEDAGVVAWVTAAFGPRCGFTQGMLFWLNGVISLAPYPLMLKDYLRYAVCPTGDLFASGGQASYCKPLDESFLPFLPSNGSLLVIVFVLVMSWLNWRGLKLVGNVTVLLVIFILIPFVVLCAVSLGHNFQMSAWFRDRPYGTQSISDVQWYPLFSTLVWCANYWDSASTLAGEVDQPEKAIPSALFYCIGVAAANYLLPILACTAALPGQTWTTGFWVQAGYELGGHLLQWWIFGAALVSFSGQFLAGQATVVYELFGMAELGQMPIFFMTRNSNGVPLWSLLSGVLMVFLILKVAGGNLGAAIAMSNGVYSLAELGNYVTFLWLRWKHPSLDRPFRIPVGLAACGLLLICPALMSILLVVAPFWTGEWKVAICIMVAAAICVLLHSFLGYCRDYFPDSFRTERQSQSQDEGLQVSLKTSGQ